MDLERVEELRDLPAGAPPTGASDADPAMEIARLRAELQAAREQAGEALEQQRATAEILRVIALSRGDAEPVLAAIARTACALCNGRWVNVVRFDGALLHLVARSTSDQDDGDLTHRWFPRAAGRDSAAGRSVLDRSIVTIPDVERDAEYGAPPAGPPPLSGSLLAVPLLRDGAPIGSIVVGRCEKGAFPERQVALLQTFAAQAVIAIENARLFGETRESVDQQQASAEVLGAIKDSLGDAAPVLERIVESCGRLFAGRIVGLNRADDADGMLRLGVYHGPGREDLQQIYPLPLTPTSGSAIAILERRVVHYADVEADGVPSATRIGCRAIGIKSVLFAPLLWQGRALGAIYVGRDVMRPFSDREIALLWTFADQAAIAIENGRLFNEVSRRNAELAEALAQQTATAEILHVISSSPSDVQPVFDAICERAIALCGARIGGVTRYDGEWVHLVSFIAPQAAEGIIRRFPMKPGPASITTRAIFEGKPVQIADILEDENYALTPESLAAGFRANLGVPMIRNGEVIGSIGICREVPGAFPDKQVRLLQTFADQAVIAIENVRLFNETKEALEQQTATAQILASMSESMSDAHAVFDAIAMNLLRLFGTQFAMVGLARDGKVEIAAFRGTPGSEKILEAYPLPIDDRTHIGRTMLRGEVSQIVPIIGHPDVPPLTQQFARRFNYDAQIGAPMVRGGKVIGAIVTSRTEPVRFNDKQVALISSFADQAVIAIENVRLFNETKDALERQTATADILRVISSSPASAQPVFEAILESSARLCEADMGLVLRYENGAFQTVATLVPDPAFDDYLHKPLIAGPLTGLGRVAATKAPVHIPDLVDDIAYRERDPLRMRSVELGGVRTWLGVPMLREGELIGAIAIYRKEVRPFEPRQIEVLKTFADQAVIAIENVRLFNATQEALETQTATAEVLRVISQSPTDVQPVFEAIAERAKVLCGAVMSGVARFDGEQLHLVAYSGVSPGAEAAMRAAFPMPPGRRANLARAVAERAPVQIPDVQSDADYEAKGPAEQAGYRSNLAVPMIREGEVIGAIGVGRPDVGIFPDRLVQLLRTFADQAVIAIENTRLFNETQEALQTQTATAAILKVISESPTNVQPVFEAIAERAKVLCGALISGVARYDGEWVHLVAYDGISAEIDRTMRAAFPMRPGRGSILGWAVAQRAPVQIPDVFADVDYGIKAPAHAAGFRSNLAVPMIKEGEVIGAIGVGRSDAGIFPDRLVQLLQTFADQAVIAIENTRLFNETQEALQTQTATADILKVISESPTDVQPVFHAIAERANVLCNAIVTGVFLFDGEWVNLVGHYGISGPGDSAMREAFPMRPSSASIAARAIRDRVPVQIADVMAEPSYGIKEAARQAGYRSNLGVPMLKEGQVVGSIVVCRAETGTFPEQQIRLLQTFADQAVIAIENVRLFNELREKSEQLELASRHKSEFLANMSHELRTPLNAIIGFTRIVMRRSKEAIEAKQYENLEKILQSGQNLLALINSILDLAKVEAGRVEIHAGDVTLAPLLADCTRTIEPLLDESAVKLVRDFDAAPAMLFTDEEKLRQIVINLLSNAAKFTPKGSITVEAMQRDDLATIAVRDTGIGIPADKLELVFEEFEQAGRTGADMQRGTGLGLTISRRLARLMGGDITATSTLGTGSTFTLTLPLRYSAPT